MFQWHISLGVFFILEEMDCWKEFGNYSSCWALPASFGNIKVAPLFEAKKRRRDTAPESG